jgi:hypothetical protein
VILKLVDSQSNASSQPFTFCMEYGYTHLSQSVWSILRGCNIPHSPSTPWTWYTSHTPYGQDLFRSHILRQMSVPILYTEYKWLVLEETDYHIVLISQHCNLMPVNFMYSWILYFNYSWVGDAIPRLPCWTCIPLI